ncbi:hypothetical protein NDU88_013059 [Pleurodeles waltl]|uniref:Uncharacterized protein n=1 Tax=Pleurodeles waltl TaxID=8319 RepID=A0AAV7R5N2_PLEWA|nr:hypothetical protein NDU88_013059 [Pleurodeles waltl]
MLLMRTRQRSDISRTGEGAVIAADLSDQDASDEYQAEQRTRVTGECCVVDVGAEQPPSRRVAVVVYPTRLDITPVRSMT